MPELEGPKWEMGIPGLRQAAFEGVSGQAVSGPFVAISKS
jgi:hypothetical protein